MLRIECHHIITATCSPHEVPTETDTVCGTIAGDMNLKRSCSSETYLSDDCMYVHTSEAVCSDEQGYIYIYIVSYWSWCTAAKFSPRGVCIAGSWGGGAWGYDSDPSDS